MMWALKVSRSTTAGMLDRLLHHCPAESTEERTEDPDSRTTELTAKSRDCYLATSGDQELAVDPSPCLLPCGEFNHSVQQDICSCLDVVP